MEFIGSNQTITDCMIVAIHNAIAAVGHKKISYDGIKNRAIKKGWYVEGFGFHTNRLKEAMDYYKIRFNEIPLNLPEIRAKVLGGRNIFLLTSPFGGGTGHAMIATKGKVGVKLINPLYAPYGWRMLCERFRDGEFTMLAYTIEAQK